MFGRHGFYQPPKKNARKRNIKNTYHTGFGSFLPLISVLYGGPKGPTQTKTENANKKEHITKQKKENANKKEHITKEKKKTQAKIAQHK